MKSHLLDLLWRFYNRLGRKLRGGHPSFAEYKAQNDLARLRQDIHTLQFQLAKVRAEKHELEQMPGLLRDTIADIFCMPPDKLREREWLNVREAEGKDGWEVVTEHCCLGGCDMGIYTLPTEREALLYAEILRVIGYHPPHNTACNGCYAEYMKDCI